jgi:hypothetical protein
MEENNPQNGTDPFGLESYKGWGIWRLYPHVQSYLLGYCSGPELEGDALQTPGGIFTPPALNPQNREGPYAGTTESFGAFYFSIKYSTPCCTKEQPHCQPPKLKGEPLNAQDYGNSGIYIFDRWEVQIVDPFRGGNGKGEGQAITGEGKNDPKFSTPGNPYGVPNNRGYSNWAKKCGEWNQLDIWFWPPTDNEPAPYLITRLNGHLIFKGELPITGENGLPINGTGSRANLPPLREGPIFIQNHWGCPVKFKDPVIVPLEGFPRGEL